MSGDYVTVRMKISWADKRLLRKVCKFLGVTQQQFIQNALEARLLRFAEPKDSK
jgi:hypothetical protein